MAHDNQYKDTEQGVCIGRFDCPKKGERYWDRHTHRVEVADKDLEEKFCIIKEGTDEALR